MFFRILKNRKYEVKRENPTASGKAKKVETTDAIGTTGGTKAVSPELMSNLEICKKREPEEVNYKVSTENFTGEILLPAKSVVVLKF